MNSVTSNEIEDNMKSIFEPSAGYTMRLSDNVLLSDIELMLVYIGSAILMYLQPHNFITVYVERVIHIEPEIFNFFWSATFLICGLLIYNWKPRGQYFAPLSYPLLGYGIICIVAMLGIEQGSFVLVGFIIYLGHLMNQNVTLRKQNTKLTEYIEMEKAVANDPDSNHAGTE